MDFFKVRMDRNLTLVVLTLTSTIRGLKYTFLNVDKIRAFGYVRVIYSSNGMFHKGWFYSGAKKQYTPFNQAK